MTFSSLSSRYLLSAGVVLCTIFLYIVTAPIPDSVFAQGAPTQIGVNYDKDDGLLSNNVESLLVVGGTIWFGTDDGISRFDGIWHSYVSQPEVAQDGEGFPPGLVTALARADAEGDVWAATDLGYVARWTMQTDSWNTLIIEGLQQGGESGTIHALLQEESILWIGADSGLLK